MLTPVWTAASARCRACVSLRFAESKFGPAQILLGLKQKAAGTWQRSSEAAWCKRCSAGESDGQRLTGVAGAWATTRRRERSGHVATTSTTTESNAREGVSQRVRCEARACRTGVDGSRKCHCGRFHRPATGAPSQPAVRARLSHLLLLLWCDDARRRHALPPPVTICTTHMPPQHNCVVM